MIPHRYRTPQALVQLAAAVGAFAACVMALLYDVPRNWVVLAWFGLFTPLVIRELNGEHARTPLGWLVTSAATGGALVCGAVACYVSKVEIRILWFALGLLVTTAVATVALRAFSGRETRQ